MKLTDITGELRLMQCLVPDLGRQNILTEAIAHLEALAWCEEHVIEIGPGKRYTVLTGDFGAPVFEGASLPDAVAKAKAWLAKKEAM